MKFNFEIKSQLKNNNLLEYIIENMSLQNIFSKKNMNLIVGLITLLVILWIAMYAIPSLFVNLFDTFLGQLILVGFIILAIMHNMLFGVGLATVFVILYQFSHMKK